jgi:hypothetical protein
LRGGIFGLLAALVVAAGCAAILDIPADRYTLVGYEPLDGGPDARPDAPSQVEDASEEPAPFVDASDGALAADVVEAGVADAAAE